MPFITQGKTNWKFLLIVIILAVITGAGGIFAWQYFGLPKESAEEPKEETREEIAKTALTLDVLKNTEYYFLTYNKKIQFINGEYENWDERIFARIYNDKVALGDLNNNGREDAVVVVTINRGGSGNFRELAVMKNQDGIPVHITSKELGDRVIINSIIIESGAITLDMIIHGPGDAMCCPSVEKIFKYKLFDNQLIEDK